MNVYKFGGSSVANASRIIQVAKITDKIKKGIIVISAMGKVDDSDEKITDLLIKLCNNKKNRTIIIERIRKKFYKTAMNLNAPSLFYEELNEFLNAYDTFGENYVISRGEYFTAKLFALYSNVPFVDSAKILKFDKNGIFSNKLTENSLKNVKSKDLFVTTGFYGSDENGNIVLLPRGGGDTTGACLANVLKSAVFYNYTDVCGLKTIPPQISNNGKTVERISVKDVSYLGFNGTPLFAKEATKYLRPQTKLIILNTFGGSEKTIVDCDFCMRKNNVITLKKGISLLYIQTYKRSDFCLYICGIFKYFMPNKIKIVNYFRAGDRCYVLIDSEDKSKLPKHLLGTISIVDVFALHLLLSKTKAIPLNRNRSTALEKIRGLFNNALIRYDKKNNALVAYIPEQDYALNKIKELAELLVN